MVASLGPGAADRSAPRFTSCNTVSLFDSLYGVRRAPARSNARPHVCPHVYNARSPIADADLMPTLTFSHLRKSYATTVASDDVTFEVRSGEVFGLLGPNGAGKSTLIRMLMDIIAPDSGEILLDGHPIRRADRDRIGYLPEERGLY